MLFAFFIGYTILRKIHIQVADIALEITKIITFYNVLRKIIFTEYKIKPEGKSHFITDISRVL